MRYLSLIIVVASIYSCSPKLHYLGDTYPASTHVDTYYSPDDIMVRFKVIGQLTNGTSKELGTINSLEAIRSAMIEEGKKRGAHGVLFLYADTYGSNHHVKADLIKYIE